MAISALTQVYRLVYEDLQYSCLYLLGSIYYKQGQYDKCFKVWKTYSDNIARSFDSSYKKTQEIKEFTAKYIVLCNSLNQFKRNILIFKNHCLPEEDNYVYYKKKGRFEEGFDSVNDLKNFLCDFDKIHEYKPNIESNFIEFYEYYRGLIHFYINSKLIFLNLTIN